MKKFFLIIALLTVSLISTNAQITPNVYKSMEYRREMLKIVGRGIVNRKMTTKGANKGKTSTAPKTLTASGTTAFKFGDKYLAPDLLLANYKGTAAEKTNAARSLAASIDRYKATAAKDGFPANDLAYSFNFFIIHNLIIYNGVKCTALELGLKGREDSCSIFTVHNYTLDHERTIYNQFRKILDTPETAKMTDGEKQLTAEMFALKVNELWDRWNAKAARPMTVDNYNIKMEAAKNLEDFLQTDVRKISITKDGINF